MLHEIMHGPPAGTDQLAPTYRHTAPHTALEEQAPMRHEYNLVNKRESDYHGKSERARISP